MNHKGKDVNSDWLAHQWDEHSVLGHARINKGRMKGDDPEIDDAQTPLFSFSFFILILLRRVALQQVDFQGALQ